MSEPKMIYRIFHVYCIRNEMASLAEKLSKEINELQYCGWIIDGIDLIDDKNAKRQEYIIRAKIEEEDDSMILKYKPKNIETVEAFQWDGHDIENLNKLLNEYEFKIDYNSGLIGGLFVKLGEDFFCAVHVGDYIVRSPHKITVMDSDKFNETYELI